MFAAALRLNRLLQDQVPLLLQGHFYDRAGLVLRELRALHQDSFDDAGLQAITEL